MKKFLCSLLVILIILGLAACGGSPGSGSKDSGSKDSAGTSGAETTQPKSDVDTGNYYYGKTIQWVVPWAAGGSTDVTTRALSQHLEKKLGCTVVVLNTQGGGGLVGFNAVSGASKDGYTMGSATSSMLLFKASGKADVGYDAVDWQCLFVYIPATIVVPVDSPHETLDDLIEYAKANPGKATYSTAGFGNYCHAALGVLGNMTGASFAQVSYNSGAEAATAAAGGHVTFAACTVTEAAAMVDSGDLRILAIIGDERSSAYPDAPSTAELGYKGMESTYTAVIMPKDCPEEALNTLNEALEEIITSDEWTGYVAGLGNIPMYIGGEDFDKFLADQAAAFEDVTF